MKAFIFAILVFAAPTCMQAQESGILEKFQNVPWQENGAVIGTSGIPAKNSETQNGRKMLDIDNLRGEKLGPRFEGWYTRITDRDGRRTFAFVGGSFLPGGIPFSQTQAMPGYLAILVSDGSGKALKVYETFPEKTALSINGKRVFNENPVESCSTRFSNDCPRADFTWAAQGYGYINNRNFALDIPGEINIKGSFGEPVYWNNSKNGSPEGITVEIPFVPIHWYVHSLGSPTNYEYNIPQEKISVKSSGYAHIEKNWGKSFPSKWMWSEGITDNNNSHYAFGGGEVDFGAFKMTSYLVGFHTQKISLDFKPQQGTFFKTFINGCNGNFSMVIARYGKQLVIDSSTDAKSFGKVTIPTAKGFARNGGVESFSARTTIEAYEVGVTGNSTLIEKKTFTNSALEFGANYMCGGF